ncbi:MAG: hypothetical protein QNJ60_15360 [Xenococcaceae cyanobacterium MO_188.B19]|nr:hypothetical protein [Xenococcaceae cyanobacterium MO_188.B19]
MLYLAQVQKKSLSGETELQILAYETTDNIWQVDNSENLTLNLNISVQEGVLVLLEREQNGTIISITEAKEWILGILQQYLTKNAVDAQFITEEKEKIEQWRQEITSQNLELNRRFLEIETRREELQQLEQSLKSKAEELQN